MPTDKQSAASRANAQKSTGPRTTAGKAASRYNALKHGIYAETHIIFDESAEALDNLTGEYHERFNPADAAERALVDTLIDNEWRIRRMRRVEADTWAQSRAATLENRRRYTKDTSQVVSVSDIFHGDIKKFVAVQRAITTCERNLRASLKELRILQTARASEVQPEPEAEPEETKATSTPSASFPNNPQTPLPQAPENPAQPIENLPEAA